jgi:predicted HTH transcriptional regulator
MREALVNLFMHQDYSDPSAVAQVELRTERATFFNTGFSLVAKERLVEGGKSQARNPLIARALRLIGFAELAGSGIRALQTAWREAQRRPPQFASDREANTFTVTLDWRLVRDTYDAVWKHRLGVRLTAEQAQILNLALDTEGITLEEAASGTVLTIDDAREALNYLQLQVLIEERQGRFYVKEHLKELGR